MKSVADEDVYSIVKSIPTGKVTTYGKIAKAILISPRQVGRILHKNPYPPIPHPGPPLRRGGKDLGVPCHRVVMADGSLASGYAFGGLGEQRKRLEAEGIKFRNGKVIKEDVV